MFGGRVWGTRLGTDTPQTRHEAEESPKRKIRHALGDSLRRAAEDALNV